MNVVTLAQLRGNSLADLATSPLIVKCPHTCVCLCSYCKVEEPVMCEFADTALEQPSGQCGESLWQTHNGIQTESGSHVARRA